MDFVLNVTEQEANVIFGALGSMRYSDVATLIAKLGQQCNDQQRAAAQVNPAPCTITEMPVGG